LDGEKLLINRVHEGLRNQIESSPTESSPADLFPSLVRGMEERIEKKLEQAYSTEKYDDKYVNIVLFNVNRLIIVQIEMRAEQRERHVEAREARMLARMAVIHRNSNEVTQQLTLLQDMVRDLKAEQGGAVAGGGGRRQSQTTLSHHTSLGHRPLCSTSQTQRRRTLCSIKARKVTSLNQVHLYLYGEAWYCQLFRP
jgi:hypothetical protein